MIISTTVSLFFVNKGGYYHLTRIDLTIKGYCVYGVNGLGIIILMDDFILMFNYAIILLITFILKTRT